MKKVSLAALLVMSAVLLFFGSCAKKDPEKIYVLRPDWHGVMQVSAEGSESVLSKRTAFPAVDSDTFYYLEDDTTLVRLSLSAGSEERFPLPDGFENCKSIVPYENAAYVHLKNADGDSCVYKVDSDGWKFVAPSNYEFNFAVGDGAVYCFRDGKEPGYSELIRADIATGDITSVCEPTIGQVNCVDVYNGRVYVGYFDNDTYGWLCSSFDAVRGGDEKCETPSGPVAPEDYTDELKREHPMMGNFAIHDGWFYFYEFGEPETTRRLMARRISDGKLIEYFAIENANGSAGLDSGTLSDRITFGKTGFVFAIGNDYSPDDDVDTVEFKFYPYKK
ncbi:MAG: hypothetical protein IK101_06350 [Oscillospiraceae bacterium]|nr:hypothetical protein [Oscillospiraceae bacterium]